MHEGRPNIVDAIKNKEIQLVINTPSGKLSKHDDSYIRKSAIKYKIPYITTLLRLLLLHVELKHSRSGHSDVKSLQDTMQISGSRFPKKPRSEERPRMSASGGFAEEKAKILCPRFNQKNCNNRDRIIYFGQPQFLG